MKSSDMKDGDAKKSGATKSGKMARGASRENVRAAQQALKDKGMDPGSVDGMMGPKTHAALREYQKKEGLKETGRLDSETMSKLGVSAQTSASESSSPAASPSTTPGTSTSPTPADASKGAAKEPGAKSDASKK
jgi:peptidoglycan hydrolase-like protein with peptidoglycan-binding domain